MTRKRTRLERCESGEKQTGGALGSFPGSCPTKDVVNDLLLERELVGYLLGQCPDCKKRDGSEMKQSTQREEEEGVKDKP